VVHVLRFLLAEADLIMPVDGYPTLTDLTPDSLRRVR
jgi:lactate 2-monooxygenase